MILGKKVAIFDWEWGLNLAPREGRKMPCFRITIRVSNSLDTDQDRHSVCSDLGPNC